MEVMCQAMFSASFRASRKRSAMNAPEKAILKRMKFGGGIGKGFTTPTFGRRLLFRFETSEL
jgi:hypothetical protein